MMTGMSGNPGKTIRIAFRTIGCRANQADTARMISGLPQNVEQVEYDSGDFDVVVINTCTVTSRADADGRRAVRRAKRKNPDSVIILTGCSAQVDPESWRAMPEVDLVIGISDRENLSEFLDTAFAAREATISEPGGGVLGPTPLHGHKSRPFLKIQDGCSRGCAYCIVPQARGPERSRPPGMILEDIHALSEAGYREIVLTGIHLGRWGMDIGQNFLSLLSELENIKSDVRIRLSSIEPMDLTPETVVEILQNRLICPHLHLPLQSGDDRILESMGRDHTTVEYANLLSAAFKTRPDMALGTDIMVGFPGEDDESFEKTLEFISGQPFTYLHVFSYSPRKSTRASAMKNRPANSDVKSRMRILRELDSTLREAFLQANRGTVRECLVETPQTHSKSLTAISDNYIRVNVKPGPEAVFPGQVIRLMMDITITRLEKYKNMPTGCMTRGDC